MAILIHISFHNARKLLLSMQRRLEKAFSMPVFFHVHENLPPSPAVIESLLTLERLLLRDRKGDITLLDPATLKSMPLPEGSVTHHIDLTGQPQALGWRPLFEGVPFENALYTLLLHGNAPRVAISNPEGQIVACGIPALENATSFGQALEVVYTLITGLLIKAINGHCVTGYDIETYSWPSSSLKYALLRYTVSQLSYSAARRIYKLCCYTPHWHVGWRWHDGAGVWENRSLEGLPWQILPDDGLRFYADPFAITWQGKTALFVEELAHQEDKGIIAATLFEAGKPVSKPHCALEEPWHLSYPCVFADDGTLYMIPESCNHGAVVLYKCVDFPYRWEQCAVLIPNLSASDATLVRHRGLYWLFCTTPAGITSDINADAIPAFASYSDSLCLFYAESLMGTWHSHPLNPVLIDAAQARHAGHFYTIKNKLYRPVQDCSRGYGKGITLCSIDVLNKEKYKQTPIKTLAPDAHWQGRRLHTLNRSGSLEVIDGNHHNIKLFTLFRSA